MNPIVLAPFVSLIRSFIISVRALRKIFINLIRIFFLFLIFFLRSPFAFFQTALLLPMARFDLPHLFQSAFSAFHFISTGHSHSLSAFIFTFTFVSKWTFFCFAFSNHYIHRFAQIIFDYSTMDDSLPVLSVRCTAKQRITHTHTVRPSSLTQIHFHTWLDPFHFDPDDIHLRPTLNTPKLACSSFTQCIGSFVFARLSLRTRPTASNCTQKPRHYFFAFPFRPSTRSLHFPFLTLFPVCSSSSSSSSSSFAILFPLAALYLTSTHFAFSFSSSVHVLCRLCSFHFGHHRIILFFTFSSFKSFVFFVCFGPRRTL